MNPDGRGSLHDTACRWAPQPTVMWFPRTFTSAIQQLGTDGGILQDYKFQAHAKLFVELVVVTSVPAISASTYRTSSQRQASTRAWSCGKHPCIWRRVSRQSLTAAASTVPASSRRRLYRDQAFARQGRHRISPRTHRACRRLRRARIHARTGDAYPRKKWSPCAASTNEFCN